jgi:hypothetical protein
MKKTGFIVLAIFVFSVSAIHAQGIHIGIKGGANIAGIDGRSFENGYKWGYTLGGFVELNLPGKWAIQPELMFSQTKTQTSSEIYTIIPSGINNVNVNLNYLTIPILLSYKVIPVLSLQLGPQFGILMSSSQTIAGNVQGAFKRGDFAMVGGAQVNLSKVKFGARYVLGLTDVNNVNDADSWKNQGFQIYFGFRIF